MTPQLPLPEVAGALHFWELYIQLVHSPRPMRKEPVVLTVKADPWDGFVFSLLMQRTKAMYVLGLTFQLIVFLV
jgi:hypothetical protein